MLGAGLRIRILFPLLHTEGVITQLDGRVITGDSTSLWWIVTKLPRGIHTKKAYTLRIEQFESTPIAGERWGGKTC